MKLGCKLALQIIGERSEIDNDLLPIYLLRYRKRYLGCDIRKNGYECGLVTGTNKEIKTIFSVLKRKIDNKTLFKNIYIELDYLDGIKLIMKKYYNDISKIRKIGVKELYQNYKIEIMAKHYFTYGVKTKRGGMKIESRINNEAIKKETISYQEWIKKGMHLSRHI